MRPCLALPFTIVSAANQVRLIAGEDFRYTLNGPELETWLPAWLSQFDGRRHSHRIADTTSRAAPRCLLTSWPRPSSASAYWSMVPWQLRSLRRYATAHFLSGLSRL